MKKAAGYVRVSTPGQVEDESLTTQRKCIEEFAKNQGYELTKIYADEGISGGSVINRHGLQKCISDGLQGKFKVLIIHRMSRFGRNAVELLGNYKELQAAGIELRSISEGIDFSTKYGEAMLGMLAVIAQLERDIIKETMLENRIARAKRGIPTSGKLPFGREFDPKTETWKLNEEKAEMIRLAADQFLNDRPLAEIAGEIGMTYNNLLKIIGQRCGDEWIVKFKDAEPIIHKIPRILSDDLIERIRERLNFNRKNNRTDLPGKYILSGFIRCDSCYSRLTGMTINYPQSPIRIYHHKKGDCQAFKYVPADDIEKAVFETIFENFIDEPSFNKAIAESLPDDRLKKEIEDRIESNEKKLKKVSKELEKLVQAVLNETLSAETIKLMEQELLRQKTNLQSHIETDQLTIKVMPNLKEVQMEAADIRRRLLERYSGLKRLSEMPFEEKRALLHWLFDGKDRGGTPYGIYVNSTGNRKNRKVNYFMYGRITGIRTLKDGNINYQEDYESNIRTNQSTGGQEGYYRRGTQ
jgi:site-specific DNA recombinase